MRVRVTVDIWSGRPNPAVVLRDAEARELLERLRPAGRRAPRSELPPLPHESMLGYRGLVVEQEEEAVRGLPGSFRVLHGEIVGARGGGRAADEGFEEYFAGPDGPLRLLGGDPDLPAAILREIGRSREARAAGRRRKKPPRPPAAKCRCAPLKELAWWNVAPRLANNNCYNYSTDYRTDTFAQPGRAAGAMYTALTCASVKPAAVKDDLIDRPRAANRCPPEGHLVALVVAPGYDYHWYRKGRDGMWTHKPGGTPATDLDNAGQPIPDPRTADRGPYTDFCTFMVVMHGHIKIR